VPAEPLSDGVVPRLPVPPTQLAGRPEIDLPPGTADLDAFPRQAWLRTGRAVLQEVSAHELGYGDPHGHLRLRGVLAGWLAETRGVAAQPGGIVIVAGVAQALALPAQVLRGQGHRAISVEDPGSRGSADELRRWACSCDRSPSTPAE
jgi:GntR family transcriptional regulator/MocR family aminotransferase